ncbi:MAG TPA: response regulator transcription factor [Candidatus Nitrosocosmicus sp.]|jgi:DNA-binding NarL/FixJ family response regulator
MGSANLSTSTSPVRIIVADDHKIFRDGLKTLLVGESNIQIIGEAENGLELVNLVEKKKPDFVLTDIEMPKMDGIKATHLINQFDPDIHVIGLSMYEEDSIIMEMFQVGAKGYLLKNTDLKEINLAINTIINNGYYYGNSTSHRIMKLLGNSSFNPFNPGKKPHFSDKELLIIKLICQEFSNKEIALKLKLTCKCVESARERIAEKIGAKNMIGIAKFAIKQGIYILN